MKWSCFYVCGRWKLLIHVSFPLTTDIDTNTNIISLSNGLPYDRFTDFVAMLKIRMLFFFKFSKAKKKNLELNTNLKWTRIWPKKNTFQDERLNEKKIYTWIQLYEAFFQIQVRFSSIRFYLKMIMVFILSPHQFD